MLLESIIVERYRNFTAPQSMPVDRNVTCLIGKNESGKTTILQAMHRLNPANTAGEFDVATEYPRRRLARDRRNETLDDVTPVTGTFILEDDDIEALGQAFGAMPPRQTRVMASRAYGGDLSVWLVCPTRLIVRDACEESGVDPEDAEVLSVCADIVSLSERGRELAKSLGERAAPARAKAVSRAIALARKAASTFEADLDDSKTAALAARLPKFFYFSAYELLPGECDLTQLAQRAKAKTLKGGDDTVIALLELAGVTPESFLDEDYVSRKAELQAASSDLSRQVFLYWTQNDALSVEFDTDMPVVGKGPQGQDLRHRVLKVELRDARHDVTTNFSTRSSGFQWFFSFLAAFSRYEGQSGRVIVLLDEPGTSLHGEAQRDFVRYIFEKLGVSQQVLYTTHSQHMLDPTRYETMRAVTDKATRENPDAGVEITTVDLTADPHTILPVEAAIGYSVSQHLFLGRGPHLAVEGSSDFIFLLRLSEHLALKGRTALDPRLSIIPVGGASNMPAFVALMGRRLDVRALIDGAGTATVAGRVRSAASAAGVSPRNVIVLGELDGLPTKADVEDLFSTRDYLWLYSRAVRPLSEADLPRTTEPILRRIAAVHGEFDHAVVAHRLTADRAEFFAQVDLVTLDHFEAVMALLRID